jgi:ankyrin repeat protein
MSAASNQDAMKRFERARNLVFSENNQAFDAVMEDNISKMEILFKTSGIKQEAIDLLIFWVKGVEMMKLFLRYGGDIYKLGPPLHPTPYTLLLNFTNDLADYAADSNERRELVKLIELLIKEGADVNTVNDYGTSPFWNCARNGEAGLCKFLVERGADPSIRRNDGGTALHAAAQSVHVDVFRYLVEDCGLDINAERQDERMRQRTPLYDAALNGNFEACKYLLEKGAKVDVGKQPLMAAAQVYSLLIFLERLL